MCTKAPPPKIARTRKKQLKARSVLSKKKEDQKIIQKIYLTNLLFAITKKNLFIVLYCSQEKYLLYKSNYLQCVCHRDTYTIIKLHLGLLDVLCQTTGLSGNFIESSKDVTVADKVQVRMRRLHTAHHYTMLVLDT